MRLDVSLQGALGEVGLGAARHRAAEVWQHFLLVALAVVDLQLPLSLETLLTLITVEHKLPVVQLEVGLEVVHGGEGPAAAAHLADEGLALQVALLVPQQLGISYKGPLTAWLRTRKWPNAKENQKDGETGLST